MRILCILYLVPSKQKVATKYVFRNIEKISVDAHRVVKRLLNPSNIQLVFISLVQGFLELASQSAKVDNFEALVGDFVAQAIFSGDRKRAKSSTTENLFGEINQDVESTCAQAISVPDDSENMAAEGFSGDRFIFLVFSVRVGHRRSVDPRIRRRTRDYVEIFKDFYCYFLRYLVRTVSKD